MEDALNLAPDTDGVPQTSSITPEPTVAAFEASAPQEPTEPAPALDLDLALLSLSDLIGAGLVRVDDEGRAWPLNETGSTLLDTLGGAAGEPAPEAIRGALDIATTAGTPQVEETLPPTLEQRHVTVAAFSSAEDLQRTLHDQTTDLVESQTT